MIKFKKRHFIIIVLCIVIFFSFTFAAWEYLILYRYNLIATYKEVITQKIAQNHGPLTEKNTDIVSSWMTFSYINTIFKLPADYLKISLNISDMHYPKLSIARYARENKLDENSFVDQVKESISNYFLNN